MLQLDDLPNLTSLQGIEDKLNGDGIREIEIGGCPKVADWSALEGADFDRLVICGSYVFVPESLKDRVDRTNGDDGWWTRDEDISFSISSAEELAALPEGARQGVREIIIAGDMIVDSSKGELEYHWEGNKEVLWYHDRETGKETKVKTGKGMDLSFLAGLPNLERLVLGQQPMTDLEALRGLTGLKELYLKCNPKLKDISAVSEMKDLESLKLAYTAVTGLESIRGLGHLKELDLNGLKITDLSPLAECDFTWSAENGGFNLSVDNNKIKDFSWMSRIPVYHWIGFGGINPDLWLDAISGSRVLGFFDGNMNQEQLEKMLEQHPELENLHIPNSQKVTDLTKVLSMPNLRYLKVSGNMKKALQSIEGKEYRFELEIE